MYIASCRSAAAQARTALGKAFALTAVAALCATLAATPAHADETAEVNRLLRAGQHAQALSRADAFLAKNPRDAQMRFLKGVILTEQNKSAEAIAVFTKLTQDHPTLPEPYNNLAVLFAANGQYDKARAALDAAIRTNPTYATAYENLGDVHAKLASQAYDKALQLDSGNSGAKSKLTLVRSLVGNMNEGTAAKPTAIPDLAQAKPAETTAPKPAPAAAPAAPAKPAAVEAPAAPKPAPTVVASAKPEAKPESKPEPKAEAKAESKPDVKQAAKANDEKNEVLAAVNGWAKAWGSQDMKAYLAYYAADFRTPGGRARKAWEDERRARIVGKDRISVKVESPQVTVNGNSATVKFHQVYVSDRLNANTRKTLVMSKNGGKWQIRQEQTGG